MTAASAWPPAAAKTSQSFDDVWFCTAFMTKKVSPQETPSLLWFSLLSQVPSAVLFSA